MISPRFSSHWTNPFCTGRLGHGRWAFISDDKSLETALGRLRSFDGSGQIVGPHGSGKTILLREIYETVRSSGPSHWIPAGTRPLPGRRITNASLFVDGLDNLTWCQRRSTFWHCRRRNVKLIVTSHRPIGLPTIQKTSVSPRFAFHLVSELLRDEGQMPPLASHFLQSRNVSEQAMQSRLERHRGNFREVLFELYDEFEVFRREQNAAQPSAH